jgi:hypothetical protein
MTRRRERTDFHGLDQAVFDGETVANVFITKYSPSQVAHDLMHIDQDSPRTLWMEGNRLDVRVNLGPLIRPVSSDIMMTANDAPLKRPRPCHVRSHSGEGGGEVPRIKRSVRRAEQFDVRGRLIWHEELQGRCITAERVILSPHCSSNSLLPPARQ